MRDPVFDYFSYWRDGFSRLIPHLGKGKMVKGKYIHTHIYICVTQSSTISLIGRMDFLECGFFCAYRFVFVIHLAYKCTSFWFVSFHALLADYENVLYDFLL